MGWGAWQRVVTAGGAVGRVLRQPNLRRVELATGGAWIAEWASLTALAVYAFEQGGAAEVGLVGLLRVLPAALLAPLGATFADRRPRERVLLAGHVVRTFALGLTAAVLAAGAPAACVYALVAVSAAAFTVNRPAQCALLPSLAASPHQLTSANAANTLIESASTLIGPAVAAVLLAVADAAAVFAVAAGASLLGVVLTARISFQSPPVLHTAPAGRRLAAEAVAGFRELARARDGRLLVALFATQTFVRGALNVYVVIVAIELLGMGRSGVGVLSAAVGAGGLVGALAASSSAGRRGLAADTAVALILWGAPLTVLGLAAGQGTALAMLAVVGVGNALLDASGMTLLTRVTDDHVLARVFGILESLIMATVGVGSVVGAALAGALGVEVALVVTGALLPVVTLLALPRLREMDGRLTAVDGQIELLRGVPMFQPLPLATVAALAAQLRPERVPAGSVVLAAGTSGDRFYVMVRGEAEVLRDGRVLAELHDGSSFGEIALLRDVPRTATIRTRTDVELYTLARRPFLAAITGYAPSGEAADEPGGRLLATVRPRLARA